MSMHRLFLAGLLGAGALLTACADSASSDSSSGTGGAAVRADADPGPGPGPILGDLGTGPTGGTAIPSGDASVGGNPPVDPRPPSIHLGTP